MKRKEAQADSGPPVRFEVISLKKSINILSAVDLAVMAIWVITLAVSLVTQNEIASVFFLIAYIISAVSVIAHTVSTVITFVKKKLYSKPLLYTACTVNTVWFLILILVIRNFSDMLSSLT